MTNEESLDTIPQLPKDWDRCHAFMERKKRFCRQQKTPDGMFCGNHQHLASTVSTKRKRVPCPLDPSHFIFEDSLDKHILVCPKATKQKEQERQFFYQSNINSGGHGTLGISNVPLDLTKAKRLANRILCVHDAIFGEGTTFDDINEATDLVDLSEPEIEQGLPEAIAVHRIKSGGPRHLRQQASLLGHLRRIGAFKQTARRRCIIELGAGRGMSGLVIAAASSGSGVKTDLLLVERSGSRGKADKILRNFTPKETAYPFDLKSVEWQRVQCDIAHLSLESLMEKPSNEEQQENSTSADEVVVVAKHLCGVGTDLALKSLYPLRNRITACVFATCCHGVCNWNGYVGRDNIQEVLQTEEMCFGEAEFSLMRKWAGTCVVEQTSDSSKDGTGTKDDGDNYEHQAFDIDDNHDGSANVSITAVAEGLGCGTRGLGRACQRLIDHGRREYIHQILGSKTDMKVEMLRYIPDSVSPQNTALIGYRKSQVVTGVKRTAASISESNTS